MKTGEKCYSDEEEFSCTNSGQGTTGDARGLALAMTNQTCFSLWMGVVQLSHRFSLGH